MKRVILIILDSVGMGEMYDAADYGDTGSNTLGNIASRIESFSLPNLQKLGLGNIDGMKGFAPEVSPKGSYGKMAEKSAGKDTTTGHWEISGLLLDKPFPTYPGGFPSEVISAFEKAIDRKTLGNIAASGTEIIMQLGDEHIRTGYPIVYTSADSVFQIAAHESVIPLKELYEMCQKARDILQGEYAVGRVIARPFTGTSGSYTRTTNRHDFSLQPTGKTILDYLKENGFAVKAVGKITDIFAGRGITDTVHTSGNTEGIDKTIEYMRENFEGMIFTNLVDFDMLYGHRNNITGYAQALKDFDARLPELLGALKKDDVFVISADHGCDPTTPSTDHSREYVPLLIYGQKLKSGINLGTRKTFSDIAATVADLFAINTEFNGKSFLDAIKE